MCMWRKYDSPLGRNGSLVCAAVGSIPYPLAVFFLCLAYGMTLGVTVNTPFPLGFGVGGHLHIADLLALLFALPFRPVNMTVFSGFTKGTSLRGHGEFVRGLVEVVFFTPFHGGMITRKRKEIKA